MYVLTNVYTRIFTLLLLQIYDGTLVKVGQVIGCKRLGAGDNESDD